MNEPADIVERLDAAFGHLNLYAKAAAHNEEMYQKWFLHMRTIEDAKALIERLSIDKARREGWAQGMADTLKNVNAVTQPWIGRNAIGLPEVSHGADAEAMEVARRIVEDHKDVVAAIISRDGDYVGPDPLYVIVARALLARAALKDAE